MARGLKKGKGGGGSCNNALKSTTNVQTLIKVSIPITPYDKQSDWDVKTNKSQNQDCSTV